jgi:hypothetical protein
MKDRKTKPNAREYDQTDCPLCPGDSVLQSGIYEICHNDEPRSQVILTVGAVFPLCRKCGEKVRYKLVRAVPHISEDPDFRESCTQSDNPLKDATVRKQIFPQQLGQAYGFRFDQGDMQAWREGSETGNLQGHS